MRYPLIILLILLNIASVVWLYCSGQRQAIFDSLATGLIIGTMIWLLTVVVPQSQHKKVARANMIKAFHDFKENTIRALLHGIHRYIDESQVTQLSDYRNFREFFRTGNDQEWYAVVNAMQEDEDLRNLLILEFNILLDEFRYLMNNIAVGDEKVHGSYRAIKENLYRLKYDQHFSYEPEKYLSNFLYELLASYSRIDGPQDKDWFEDRIKNS